MNILLYHPEKEPLKMIAFCIESQMNLHVLSASDVQQAIELFLGDNSISLVIASQEPRSDTFFKFLLSVSSKVPVVLIHDNEHKNFAVFPGTHVLGSMELSEVPEKLKQLIDSNADQISIPPLSDEYCRIKTELLMRVAPLKGDVFIRLSSHKFVKLFHAGDQFTAESLERFLVKRHVEYLYLRREDSLEFVKKLKEDLTNSIGTVSPDDPQIMTTVTEVHSLVQELTRHLGFTKEVQQIARENVQLTVAGIGTKPKIANALAASKLASRNYISSHSVLLAHIACAIAAQMDWPSNTTFQKLVLAAFFHDFVFQDVNLAKINTLEEITTRTPPLKPDEVELITNHPLKCADIIKSMTEIPSDVDIVILQHHEKPDGSGFPRKIHSHQVAPLSAVFIVAHDILNQMLKLGEKFILAEFLKASEEKYDSHAFRKVWKALSQTPE